MYVFPRAVLYARLVAALALRLPWKTPPGIVLAVGAMFAAHQGWFAKPLGLTRPAELTLGIVWFTLFD